jgi:hypothetical protein
VDAPQSQFSLALSATSLTLQAGASGTVTVTTTLVSGTSESVTLTAAGLPAGVTATFNPPAIPSDGGGSTLTFTVDPGAPSSSAAVTVAGASPSATQSGVVSLTVTGAAADAGSCALAMCATGDPLDASCDPCAGQICQSDPFCCNTQWDSICVGEVGSICGGTCQ